MTTHIEPLHVYTMKYTESITFNFPNVPQLGNSLIYVWSMMGEGALPATEGGLGGPGLHYNGGLGPHELDFGSLLTGDTSPAVNTGGNGASTAVYWTQCVQATFNSVTIGGSVDNAGLGAVVTSYLTIYEVEGLIGQTPGVPTSTNFNPIFDWKPNHAAAQGIVTVADGSLIALGEHMVINPGIENCSCPPPVTCGDNDHQAKFTLGANKATVIANCAIPDVDFFNVVDPCDPSYVSNDFVFAVCSNGTADALTLTDNIQGQWHIDYQIDGQIFGHVTDAPPPPTGNISIVKATVPGGATQPFTFHPSWEGSFVLHDGQSHLSPALAPGTYSITEDSVSNWDTTTSSDPANIVVVAGVTTTLIFTNTFVPPAKGRIIVHKVTNPVADPQGFTFRPSWGAPFVLGDGQQNDSGPLDAGTYAVTEDPVDGWTTETSQDPSTIVVVDGSNTDITFTNTKAPICIVQPPETGVMKFARGIGDLNNEMLALECSNEAVPGAWFELHEMVLYARPSAQSRKG